MKKIDTCLLIDDDPIVAFGVKRMMEYSHLCKTFMVFPNGQDAIDYLKPAIETGIKVPELILLDINMPVMDGWEFLKEFVKMRTPKPITIYMLSSSIDPEDIEKARAFDEVKDYIVKPISMHKLKEIMAD